MIDILIPVLARPQNVAPLIESIRSTTKVPCAVLFLCSPGDEEQIEACHQTGERVEVVPWEAGRSDYPKKMNLGYQLTDGEYLLMGGDDVTFQASWDLHVMIVAEQTGAGVVGTDDCANRQVRKGYFSTHALVRRSYIAEVGASLDGPGSLMSETYDHNYCDRELCALAQARGQWAFAHESKIIHRHPCWGTAAEDSTYIKGKANMAEDHGNFFERSQSWGYVGLTAQERKYIATMQRRRNRLKRVRS